MVFCLIKKNFTIYFQQAVWQLSHCWKMAFLGTKIVGKIGTK
jgi:hypothetical protein